MSVTPVPPPRSLDRVLLLASLVLTVCTRPASSAPTLEAFFKPAPDAAAKLDAHGVYPRGRIFPMTMFSVGGIGGGKAPEAAVQAALKQYKADGFTMIGPQYELGDRLCADAEATGLTKKQVAAVLEALTDEIRKNLSPRGAGVVAGAGGGKVDGSAEGDGQGRERAALQVVRRYRSPGDDLWSGFDAPRCSAPANGQSPYRPSTRCHSSRAA